MIYKKQTDVLKYQGEEYQVGTTVKANAQSVYEGLIGFITEIRTGKDKETKNPSPDIYCDFIKPNFQKELQVFQHRYVKSYNEPFDLDNINLDGVIMAPEMLVLVNDKKKLYPHERMKLYLLQEEWVVDGEGGVEVYAFFDYDEAKENYRIKIYEEKRNNCIQRWIDNEDFEEEIGEMEYSAYLNNEYSENHYCLWIKEYNVPLTNAAVAMLYEQLELRGLYKDFAQQVEDWEALKGFTPMEREAFIHDSSIPSRILKKLSGYKVEEDDAYTHEVSEVAHELLSEYLARKNRLTPKEVKKNETL